MLTQWCKSFIKSGFRGFSFRIEKLSPQQITKESTQILQDELNYTAETAVKSIKAIREICKVDHQSITNNSLIAVALSKLERLVQDLDEKTFAYLVTGLHEIHCDNIRL